jgi:hypothetical protein
MSLLTLLSAGFVVLQLSATAPPTPATPNERTRCEVVISDMASVAEQRAADEVAAYLTRMTDSSVSVVAESSTTAPIAVFVGRTQRASSVLPKDFYESPERVIIKTVPDGVIVCGGSDRGTLYAAYRFLDQLGCRWLTHNPADEIVPKLTTLQFPTLDVDSTPAFDWRLFRGSFPRLEPWGLKLGLNGFYSADEAATNGGAFYFPQQADGVHTFSQLIPADRYFEAHPDWFVTQLGSPARQRSEIGGQLCLTAPGLVDEFSSQVRSIFNEDPNCHVLSISPNDGYGWCTCERCRQLDKQLCGGRDANMGTNRIEPFVGDRLFWFGNQVVEQIAETHPDRHLLMLAYVNYVEPPNTIVPASNIIPFVCHYAPADYSRAIADPESEANRQFNELLQRWTKLSQNVMIYSYVGKSMWWELPRPITKTFAADVRHFHQLGIRRYYCQSRLNQWELDGPLYYVITKMLWDPAADAEQLADEWIAGMFGPAATEMKSFYSHVEQAVTTTGQSYSDDPPGQVPGLYDQTQLRLAMEALQRAKVAASVAEDDKTVVARIDKVDRVFRKGYWMIQSLEEDKLGPAGVRFGVFWMSVVTSVAVCIFAWRRQLQVASSSRSATPAFWLLTALIVAFFAADRIFGLQHSGIDALRQFVESQPWYQRREVRQLVFLVVMGSVGTAMAFGFLWTARRQFKRNLLAAGGVLLLCVLFAARATAFQRYDGPAAFRTFDARFREVCGGMSCEAMAMMISCVVFIIAGVQAIRQPHQTDSSGTEGDPSKRDSPDDVDRPLRSE